MRTQWTLTAIGFVTLMLMIGCVTPRQPIQVPEVHAPAPVARVEQPGPPVEVPFVKLIQPAFAGDYAGKTVTFDAAYSFTLAIVMDLPDDYKQGYIRVNLCSETPTVTGLGGSPVLSCDNPYNKVVIPKADSDVVFSLKEGAHIAVVADAVPVASFSGITGGGQKTLLLVVKSIKKR